MGARKSPYPFWFYLPAFLLFFVLFLLPTFSSFYYSLTRWTLFESEFIGLDNFTPFFEEPALTKGLTNTLIYGFVTSGLKVVLGMLLAVLLTAPIVGRGFMRSIVFFPTLVSWIGVGLTFTVLLHPSRGLVNNSARASSASPGRAGSSTRSTCCCRSRSWTSGRAWVWPR